MIKRFDLTIVTRVYIEDFPVHTRAASRQHFLVYSKTDLAVLSVRGLISELKPDHHNLHLLYYTSSTCREKIHYSLTQSLLLKAQQSVRSAIF